MFTGASLLAQSVKNLPAKWETQVSSLCWEDPLEKETAALSSILAWRMWWTEEPGGLQSVRSQTLRHGLGTNTFTGTFVFTEHVFWASGHITLYLDYVLQASQPVCCFMPSSNFCFLTCIQLSQEADQVVWYSHFFQNFPVFIVIYTIKALA